MESLLLVHNQVKFCRSAILNNIFSQLAHTMVNLKTGLTVQQFTTSIEAINTEQLCVDAEPLMDR